MIRDFEHYLKRNLAKQAIPNPAMAKSLLIKAELRLKLLSDRSITEETATILFEETYEALREASQSLMQIKGFKPYSHEALIAFLIKKSLMPEQFTKSLDRYRLLRNKVVYEAHNVSVVALKEALEFARSELPKIKEKLSGFLAAVTIKYREF